MEKRLFKINSKKLSHFHNKAPEELKSQSDNFDDIYSYPTPPFKGRNIMDLDFMYKHLLDGMKVAKPHYPWHNIKEKD